MSYFTGCKFTYHKIHHVRVYNSVIRVFLENFVFGIGVQLSNNVTMCDIFR